MEHLSTADEDHSRRAFLKKNLLLGGLVFTGAAGLFTGCKEEEGEGLPPTEDLMREHGLLNRVLLIYDNCKTHLQKNISFPIEYLTNAASIIKIFVEDYHEKMEEDFIFPRLQKANTLTDLVTVLKNQHDAGRAITMRILQYKNASLTTDDKQTLITLLDKFNTMYRPHEAREDTILFPTVRKIVSKHEFDAMGEDFEKKEHSMFGEDGFEHMLDKVAAIEKQLGIYDLSQFTPGV